MKKTLFILAVAALAILLIYLSKIKAEPKPYQKIKIKEVFSSLITRDEADRVYSGQIKSKAGLTEFENTYNIKIENLKIDFNKDMLIFGITDNISTRAFQFLKQEISASFTLDYFDTGIMYKLAAPDEGKKYFHIQVFVLNKIENIPHIKVKNLVRDGLSIVYDK